MGFIEGQTPFEADVQKAAIASGINLGRILIDADRGTTDSPDLFIQLKRIVDECYEKSIDDTF